MKHNLSGRCGGDDVQFHQHFLTLLTLLVVLCCAQICFLDLSRATPNMTCDEKWIHLMKHERCVSVMLVNCLVLPCTRFQSEQKME